MRRVPDSNYPVRDLFGKGKHGFGPGDKTNGTIATIPGAAFMNAVQEEIAGVIEKAGLVLDSDSFSQLYDAILKITIKQKKILISIAELRNLKDVEDYELRQVFGAFGSIQNFYADPNDTTSVDDGVSIVVSSDGMRWKNATSTPDIKAFGAVGNYTADDTEAFAAALTWAAANSRIVRVPAGVYRLTHGFKIHEGVSIIGEFSPRIATFPQVDANKRNFRQGNKHKIVGSVLMFSGGNSAGHTVVTTRNDKYASVKPCLSYEYSTPNQMLGFAVLQDMDIYSPSNTLTNASNDNRATGYTAGYVTASTLSRHEDFNVFGYFSVAGAIVYARNIAGTVDSEYAAFDGSVISSGLAIVGASDATSNVSLTGVMASNSCFYGCDHHTRADGDYTIPALYIDGEVGQQGIRGHSFSACQFRTYANEAIKFGRCNDINMSSCITEFSTISGVSNADAHGKIVGSSKTGNIRLSGIAAVGDLGIKDLIATVSGKVQVIGAGGFDDAYFGDGNHVVTLGGNKSLGDSIITLTSDIASTNNGWTIRRDGDQSDRLDFRYNGVWRFQYDLVQSSLKPALGGQSKLGTAAEAWTELYVGATPIITSDGRLKQDISSIPDGVIEAWRDVNWCQYRWIDAVAKKGVGARYHVGLIAQSIKKAFDQHGFDAQDYGLICYDQWPEQPMQDAVVDDDGSIIELAVEYRPAGERWAVRMDECLAMEAESQRRMIAHLAARVAELEKKI